MSAWPVWPVSAHAARDEGGGRWRVSAHVRRWRVSGDGTSRWPVSAHAAAACCQPSLQCASAPAYQHEASGAWQRRMVTGAHPAARAGGRMRQVEATGGPCSARACMLGGGGGCWWCVRMVEDEAGGAGCAFSSSKACRRSKASKAGVTLLEAGGSGMGGRPWRSVASCLRSLRADIGAR